MNRSEPDSSLTSDDGSQRSVRRRQSGPDPYPPAGEIPTASNTAATPCGWATELPDHAPRSVGQLEDYNGPDLHPDDSVTTELVETWRTELFGVHGTSDDKLIGVAA